MPLFPQQPWASQKGDVDQKIFAYLHRPSGRVPKQIAHHNIIAHQKHHKKQDGTGNDRHAVEQSIEPPAGFFHQCRHDCIYSFNVALSGCHPQKGSRGKYFRGVYFFGGFEMSFFNFGPQSGASLIISSQVAS